MMLRCRNSQDVIIQSKHPALSLVINNTRVIATSAVGVVHDVSFILPRTRRRITHGIANTFRTTGRCKCQVVMPIALIEPRTFLIIIDFVIQFCDFARIGNHVLVQLHIIHIWVSPIHICLSVSVYPHRWVDVVPVLTLPDERFADRVNKRTVWRICNKHTDAMPMNRAIHIELSISLNDLLSPSTIVTIIPLEIFQRSHGTTILPVHHVGRSVEQPVLHLEPIGIVLIVSRIKENRVVIHHRCRVGSKFSLNNRILSLHIHSKHTHEKRRAKM